MQHADTAHPRLRRRCARATAVCAAVLGAALLVAACGSSGKSPGVANVSSTTATSTSPPSSSSSSPSSSASLAPTAGGGAVGGGGSAGLSSSPNGQHAQQGFAIAGGNGANLLKFSQCMRANGVPNFPDPNAQGVIQGSGFNPQSPGFQAAMKKCRKYGPNGGRPPSAAQQQVADAKALAFSQCMRSHGVPDFPDPQISGGSIRISIHSAPGSGLHPGSPIFQKAQKDCQADLPGALGKAGPPPAGK